GLHFDDLAKLLEVLQRLVDWGNTVVVIEHNLDIIKCCDWVIDLGPEAGEQGGEVVVAGTPEMIVEKRDKETRRRGEIRKSRSPYLLVSQSPCPVSHTAEALRPVLAAGAYAAREAHAAAAGEEKKERGL